MFSDFQMHVAAIPQIAPFFGVGEGNMIFDGPGEDEDFGLEQVTGSASDRYAFRTSPLRNVAVQPAFFHNGAFTRLEDALRFHLDAAAAAPLYVPAQAGVDADLRGPLGPTAPVLARLDPLVQAPVALDEEEFRQLLAFVRDGLRDPRATPERLRKLIPKSLPSGRPTQLFQ
jgi:cytochrome c peroxidase